MKGLVEYINEKLIEEAKKPIIDISKLKDKHKQLIYDYINNFLEFFNKHKIKISEILSNYSKSKKKNNVDDIIKIQVEFNNTNKIGSIKGNEHLKYWHARDKDKWEFPIAGVDTTFDDGKRYVYVLLGVKDNKLVHVNPPTSDDYEKNDSSVKLVDKI